MTFPNLMRIAHKKRDLELISCFRPLQSTTEYSPLTHYFFLGLRAFLQLNVCVFVTLHTFDPVSFGFPSL